MVKGGMDLSGQPGKSPPTSYAPEEREFDTPPWTQMRESHKRLFPLEGLSLIHSQLQPMLKFRPWPTTQLHQATLLPLPHMPYIYCLEEIDHKDLISMFTSSSLWKRWRNPWPMWLREESLMSVFQTEVQVVLIPFISICICHMGFVPLSSWCLFPIWGSFCL